MPSKVMTVFGSGTATSDDSPADANAILRGEVLHGRRGQGSLGKTKQAEVEGDIAQRVPVQRNVLNMTVIRRSKSRPLCLQPVSWRGKGQERIAPVRPKGQRDGSHEQQTKKPRNDQAFASPHGEHLHEAL